MKGVYMGHSDGVGFRRVYPESVRRKIEQHVSMMPQLVGQDNVHLYEDALREAEVIFGTWGMWEITDAEIDRYFPRVKAVFYAAGSVQHLKAFIKRGVLVCSASYANGIPVAQYAASVIGLAAKGFFQTAVLTKKGEYEAARELMGRQDGFYRTKIGILGAGMIGTIVIELLRDTGNELMVFDPFMSEERANELGVIKAGLHDVFAQCSVISNHLANNDQTQKILDSACFSRMRPDAVFVNTGRGAQVDEEALVQALRASPSRAAVLDVTCDEPPRAGHPFYELENVVLTPHIAGSQGNEQSRMSELAFEEYLRYAAGEPVRYGVTEKMLETMA